MNNKVISINNLTSHIDKRGVIQMILESCSIGSISRISSVAGTTRANHWHRQDSHFIEVLLGQVELYELPLNSGEKPVKRIVRVGEIAYTPCMQQHTMYFPVDTLFNCYSKLPRNQNNYEADTVRFDYSLKDLYDN